ncbi:MAG: RluA family pseudouridine synthase [Propionibacteriaceae bacterium]|jgi:23S rRNA pseudouridine1911/1915/1917 synthase|nr:RluA family pseudouridine synthase [Propionibacteriaceae bacterium]
MPLAIGPEGLEGLRADVGAARLFGLARSVVEQAAEQGGLRLDGREVRKSVRLATGMMLEVDVPEQRVAQVRPRLVEGMRVVYDDADLVVVDKPAGIAAHPSLGWEGGSVVEHLVAAGFEPCPVGPPERPGIVSRLDVGTSGLMVVARSELAFVGLKRAFTNHEVDKVYHALVQGYPDPMSGTIDAPIGHARTDEWKMAVDATGRPAVTHYGVIEAVVRATLLRVLLETGRTHQIRVHMAAIHHPCVGDLLYGADPRLAEELGLRRQWLHAVQLGFEHPRSGEPMVFTSQYPADLAASLDALRID